MFSKFELIGAAVSVFFMAFAIYLLQVEKTLFQAGRVGQSAQVIESKSSSIAIVSENEGVPGLRESAYLQALDKKGNFNRMVIDDVKVGNGASVKEGDTVSVHYVGTFQNGDEFDSSKKRGIPFEFRVGKGMVIEGWDKGLIGMQVGGERVLVIPPDMAYGEKGVGPIPGNSTLVFLIELLEIK